MTVKLIHEGGGNWRAANALNAELCDKHFELDEPITLVEVRDRSIKSHRQYFVLIEQAWRNLPESLQMEPYSGSPEHLRKHALIMSGYRSDPTAYAMASKAEAVRSAPILKAAYGDYALAHVRENVVTIFTAKSQSMKAMGRRDFQESKDAVLTWCSELIGVDVMALRSMGHNGGPSLEDNAA